MASRERGRKDGSWTAGLCQRTPEDDTAAVAQQDGQTTRNGLQEDGTGGLSPPAVIGCEDPGGGWKTPFSKTGRASRADGEGERWEWQWEWRGRRRRRRRRLLWRRRRSSSRAEMLGWRFFRRRKGQSRRRRPRRCFPHAAFTTEGSEAGEKEGERRKEGGRGRLMRGKLQSVNKKRRDAADAWSLLNGSFISEQRTPHLFKSNRKETCSSPVAPDESSRLIDQSIKGSGRWAARRGFTWSTAR
ncbi:hypothetical protein VTN96DRAFT_8752 [Rasamsonia emersonii]